MPGAFSKEQKLRRFLKAKRGVRRRCRGRSLGVAGPDSCKGRAQVSDQGTWPLCVGEVCLTFLKGRKTQLRAWESGERFVGLIVSRRVCMGCAGHIHPGATHRLRPPELCALTRPVSSYPPPQHRTSPTTPHPSTHNPSRSPVRSIPPLLSPRGPPPAGSAGPAHYPESAATRPARKRDHPSPSSSSTPPFLLLLACSPLGSRAVCASVSGPLPRPTPGPGPPPPSRRTCPLPGRPRAWDRDRAERSRRASSPCA